MVSRSLFPAFSTALQIRAPAVRSSNNDGDVRITDTHYPSLPSFDFSVSSADVLVKQHLPDQRVTADAFSSEDEVTVTEVIAAEKLSSRKKRKRKEKVKKRTREKDRLKKPAVEPKSEPEFWQTNNPKATFLRDTDLPPEKAFCIDSNPDRNNFAFTETYWKNVTKHRKPPRWTFGEERQWSSRKQDRRYFEAVKELNLMKTSVGTRIIPLSDVEPFGRNYLPLPVDSLDSDVLNQPAVDSSENDFIRNKTINYNESLRKHPRNIKKWLEFIKFQDDVAQNMFGSTTEDGEAQKKLSRTGLQQRKVAILDRAIENNPENMDLHMHRLFMCEEFWEKEQLTNEWRKLAFNHPNNFTIWKAYLFFLQSYFSVFSPVRIVKAYQKYLSVSLSIDAGTFHSHSALPHHMEHASYFVHLLAAFWMDCGFYEKSVALLQAFLELNCNFPGNLNKSTPLKDALTFLEPFWDSGVPRFGEKYAVGWKNIMGSRAEPASQQPDDLHQDEDNLLQSSSSSAELWMKLEHFRETRFLLPYHAPEEPTDPERIVLFDDISPFLFRLSPDQDTEHIIFSVVTNTLTLLHCSIPRNFSTRSSAWRTTLPCALNMPVTFLFSSWSESHFCPVELTDNYSSTLFQPFQNHWTDQDMLINGIFEQSSQYFTGVYRSFLAAAWLQYKLYRFASASDANKPAVAKEVRGLAKNLLKKPENRNDLLVWEWYAFVESRLEGSAAATRIIESVLSFCDPFSDDINQALRTARIVRFYVENALGIFGAKKIVVDTDNSRRQAMTVLIQFAEKTKMNAGEALEVTPSRLLRCKRNMEQTIEIAYQRDDQSTSRLYALGSLSCNLTLCSALLEHLTSGFDGSMNLLVIGIERCRTVLSSHGYVDFDVLREKTLMDWEILTESLVRLALFHQKNEGMSSSVFRDIVLNALKDFPDNSILLTIFVHSEMSAFISGRLREYFSGALVESTTAVPWLFAIYSEYERKYRLWKNLNAACQNNLFDAALLTTYRDTGISHKLRSIFEQATESESVRHSPLIWRLYLKFEIEEDNLRRAEGVYFRAIQSCPWEKNVYTDAIRFFPHRVQEILDLMTEKELRVLAPYDEVDLLMKSKKPLTLLPSVG